MLTAVALGLGLLLLSRESLWLDEAVSVRIAGSSWTALWTDLSRGEANMAPYYVLLHAWLAIGKSTLVLRSLSAVTAAAAVPPFVVLATRLLGRGAALFAGLLLVVNAFFVYYAQEGRGYSLALLVSVLATLCFTRWWERRGVGSALLYGFVAAVGVYCHFYVAFVIAVHLLCLVLQPVGRRPPRREIAAAAAVLAGGLLPLALYFAVRDTGNLDWVPKPGLRDLGAMLASLSGGSADLLPVAGKLLLVGYAAAGCTLLIAIWQGRRRPNGGTFALELIVAWLVLPTLVAFAVSQVKPILVDRYLIVSLPAFPLAAAAALQRLRGRALALAAATVVTGLSLAELATQYSRQVKEDWRDAAAYVDAHDRPGDAIVFYPDYIRAPFEYYALRGASPPPRPLYPAAAWGRFDPTSGEPLVLQSVLGKAQDRRRVWLVVAHAAFNSTDQSISRTLATRLARDRTARTRTFRGPIAVTLLSSP